ncbi:hypothetical protein JKP88DRAFT_289714 [Tribonema minus]|uniref:histidine kinase n=1 Tax=Tribonema minus TaxID=303371 RepID=A0A835Z1M8_9STRA|nr:hypothetical protein JKP88DRAFT_289714 [Tribonema minus]
MAARVLHMPLAALCAVTEDQIIWLSWVGPGAVDLPALPQSSPRGIPLIEDAIRHPRAHVAHVVLDTVGDGGYAEHPLPGGASTRFCAASPLLDPGSGVAVGALCVMDTAPRGEPLDAAQVEFLADFAALAMSELHLWHWRTRAEFLADFAALAMSELHLRRELRREHLSYITSTAHALRTPMACFDLCLGILREAAATDGGGGGGGGGGGARGAAAATPREEPSRATALDVLSHLRLSANAMSWSIAKAISESRAVAERHHNNDDADTDEEDEDDGDVGERGGGGGGAGGVGCLAGAGRVLYATRVLELATQCAKLMRGLPALRVPIQLLVVSPGDAKAALTLQEASVSPGDAKAALILRVSPEDAKAPAHTVRLPDTVYTGHQAAWRTLRIATEVVWHALIHILGATEFGCQRSDPLCVVWHALIDLLTNAARHTEVGCITVLLSASVRQQICFVKVEVHDTGCGIAQKLTDGGNLFRRPFVTASGSGDSYGLGLFTVASNVRAIGGTCGLSARPQRPGGASGGACVWFEFPDYGSGGGSGAAAAPNADDPLLRRAREDSLATDASRAALEAESVTRGRGSTAASSSRPGLQEVCSSGRGRVWRASERFLHSCRAATRTDTRTLRGTRAALGEQASRPPGSTADSAAASLPDALAADDDATIRVRRSADHSAAAAAAAAVPLLREAVVVDDSGVIRRLMARLLEANGWRAVTAHDGREGLELLRSGRQPLVFMAAAAAVAAATAAGLLPLPLPLLLLLLALLLLDFLMPRLSGIECTRAYRKFEAQHRRGRRHIIGVSANASETDIADGLQAGMDQYRSKPFTPAALADLLHRFELLWAEQYSGSAAVSARGDGGGTACVLGKNMMEDNNP